MKLRVSAKTVVNLGKFQDLGEFGMKLVLSRGFKFGLFLGKNCQPDSNFFRHAYQELF